MDSFLLAFPQSLADHSVAFGEFYKLSFRFVCMRAHIMYSQISLAMHACRDGRHTHIRFDSGHLGMLL